MRRYTIGSDDANPQIESAIASRNLLLVMFALAWLVAGFGTILPFADSVLVKGGLLLGPFALSFLVVLVTPAAGFALWSLALGFLISQTGFLIDIGAIRTSSLEVGLLLLVPILLWSHRFKTLRANLSIPGQRLLALFVLYALAMLPVGLARGAQLVTALQVLKGFLIYPLMIYIILAGLRTRALLQLSITITVIFLSYYAVNGLLEFSAQGIQPESSEPFRASGAFASINTFGITVTAVSLLVFGIAFSIHDSRLRMLLVLVACVLFLGAATSAARTVWIAGGVGMLYLAFTGKRRGTLPLVILALGGALLLINPDSLASRVLQLSDSSTVKRAHYLTSGLEGIKANWLTGWGWGMTYWSAGEGSSGIAYPGMPWFHNEYLNLGVQTGVVGLALYLGFWLSIIAAAHRWLGRYSDRAVGGYVHGCQAALISLFIASATEHIWWKPDIAGLAPWIAGVMLAAMRLVGDES